LTQVLFPTASPLFIQSHDLTLSLGHYPFSLVPLLTHVIQPIDTSLYPQKCSQIPGVKLLIKLLQLSFG